LHDVGASEVAAIAVATGPGTFNGLRVGISVAKGLVLGLGVPLIGVPTLAVAALPFATAGRPVVPIVAAGRGRLVWATYRSGAAGWREAAAARNGTVEQLAEELADAGGAIVTGELDPTQEATVAAVPSVELPPRPLRVRRPAAVAAIAWARFRSGDHDDPVALEPVYLGR
jgi:tRNA threonylcarbamoyladenosine biosynthesis protein TsaB